jgi:glucose-6-phosphate isomerase
MDEFQTALAALRQHHDRAGALDIRAGFAADPARFDRLSLRLDDLLLDFSKCALDPGTMPLLADLARAAGVERRREAMFSGARINVTEDRAVLHVALRNLDGGPMAVDGRDVTGDVKAVLAAMEGFADALRGGRIRGATGEPITDVVNIGIGGSDLGPAMAVAAL